MKHDDDHIRYRFAGYGNNGLPVYDIVDTEKNPPRFMKRTNEPILGTRGDKHDERE